MSDVFTKRAAQQKLGTIVRGKKDLWDGTPGHLFGRVVGFRSCGRGNYVKVEWLIPQSETPLPYTEFSRYEVHPD
jgi:hypothetical protein